MHEREGNVRSGMFVSAEVRVLMCLLVRVRTPNWRPQEF